MSYTRIVSFKMPEGLERLLRECARRHYITRSQAIRLAILQLLEEKPVVRPKIIRVLG